MKNRMIKTSIVAAIILLSLTFNAFLVQADPVGIGKFVNITVIESQTGEVTLTKLSSGETLVVNTTELIKVGAGTVRLSAESYDGYVFDHWLVDDVQIDESEYTFKTSKGTLEVEAYFARTTYYITATANGPGTINGVTSLVVPLAYGTPSPVFEFAPTDSALYHISSIQIDSIYVGYTTSFAFPDPITSDHTITVNFNDVGVAQVPKAEQVPVFLDSLVSLFFNNASGGLAQGAGLFVPYNDSISSSILFWDITTDAVDTDDGYVTIQFNSDVSLPETVTVYRAESADALYSDVNMDGVVDGKDVSLVAQGIKDTVSSGAEYDPLLDTDRDTDLDEDDVHTVNENRGAELFELTAYVVGNTLYIETDHFSVFRCR